MKRTHWLIAALVLVHVVLHVIALLTIHEAVHHEIRSSFFEFFLFALFMLGPSQATLLAFWVAFGGGRFLWRVLPIVVGAVVYLRCITVPRPEWRELTIGQLGVLGVLVLVARVVGFELVRCKDLPTASSRFQFTIRDMLSWMTALAVILGALHYMPEGLFPTYSIADAIVVFGSFVLVAVTSIILALCNGWLLARLLLLPLTIGSGAAWLASHPSGRPVWYLSLLLGLMSVWIAASLLVVRYAGYRLIWWWRFGRKNLESKATGQPRPSAG
jgi:hypothetical protein